MLREKCIKLNAYSRKEERYKMNHQTLYFRILEKEEHIKSHVTGGKEIVTTAEINEIENRN